jgi:Large polyvalent protein-associated domain 3
MKITAQLELPSGSYRIHSEDYDNPLALTEFLTENQAVFDHLPPLPSEVWMDAFESTLGDAVERAGGTVTFVREGFLLGWSTGTRTNSINAAEGKPCGDSWIAPGKECRKEGAYFMKLPTNLKGARLVAKAFLGKPITNEADGRVATVSRNNLDKMLSKSAVSKSASTKLHCFAVANLEHLFKAAVLKQSHDDRDGKEGIKKVHRYYSAMKIEGVTHELKITVKEFSRKDEGNKIYTVEVLK